MPETDPGTSEPQRAAARPGRHASGEPVSAVSVPDDDAGPGTGAGTGAGAPVTSGGAAPASSDDAAAASRADAAPAARGDAAPSRRDRKEHAPDRNPLLVWLKEIATVVVIAVVLSFLIKTFLFRAFYIPSESMVSTLDINDRIFVNLLVPEPFALERGDVVVFKDTKGWLPPTPERVDGPFTWFEDGLTFVGLLPDNSEQHLVKRVIGLPGDHVVCCDADGKLTVNGASLDEKYVNPAEVPMVRDFDVVVPAGKVWVMGDNRNHSADSRAHMDSNGGFVDITDIEGEAAVIAWPVNRWAALDRYPDVFKNVPPAG
jgi:signal peptidase I